MANLTGTQINTLMTNYRGNTAGATDAQVLEWVNFLCRWFHNKVVSLNPNDYLTNSIIKTISDTASYALPSGLQHIRHGGVYKVASGTDYTALNYDGQTVNFTAGSTLTGGTTGYTATIAEVVDYGTTGTLRLTGATGTFADNETITGSGGGSATANGTSATFKYSDDRLPETGFGSEDEGYWLDGTNINLTPTPDSTEVYILRYVPEFTTLAALASSTNIPVIYSEFARLATDVYLQQWRDAPSEMEAFQRLNAAWQDCGYNIRKTPMIFKL